MNIDPDLRRPRLLIADDDGLTRSLLGASLEHEFEIVGYAADAQAAVSLAGHTLPDVALIDVEMPEGGGPRAVRGITEVAPGTAIVVLSADEEDTTVRALLRAGAAAYCRKGIPTHELGRQLLEAVRVRGAERPPHFPPPETN